MSEHPIEMAHAMEMNTTLNDPEDFARDTRIQEQVYAADRRRANAKEHLYVPPAPEPRDAFRPVPPRPFASAASAFASPLNAFASLASTIVAGAGAGSIGKLQVKRLSPAAILPLRATAHSAGFDLYSPIDAVVPAGGNRLIKTDVAIAWTNPEFYLQLHSRSGIAFKANVSVEGGVVDADYRDNIGVILRNAGTNDYQVRAGDRIAQAVPTRIVRCEIEEVVEGGDFEPLANEAANEATTTTSARQGGFGSTGK